MPAPSDPVRLTLRLDRRTAEAARRYARAQGTSVSQLVARLLRAVAATPETSELPPSPSDADWQAGLSPATRRLLDRPPAPEVSEDDRLRWLEEKYG